MEFADAHLAHQDPQWLSHTYQDMEWYKRNKANFASIFSSILKGWGQKKSLNDDDCLLCAGTWEVFCITPVSYQNRYVEPSAAEWIHFLLPLHKEQTGPGVTVNRLHITELQLEEWLRKRTLHDCYLHILLPEQWGPTWSWHSIHTSAGPWTCAPGRQ